MKKNILRLFVIVTLISIGYSLIAPLFPFIALSKEVHEGTVGLIFSSYAASNIIIIPLINNLIEVFGRKGLCFIGITICSICTFIFGFLCSMSNRLLFILFASVNMFFEGIGVAILLIMLYSIAASLSSDRNIKANIGYLELAYSLGLSLGPLLGAIIYYFAGYSTPFYFVGVLILSGLLLIKKFEIIDEPSDNTISFFRVLLNKDIIITFLAILCDMMSTSFIFPVFSTHLFNTFGLRVEIASLFFVFEIIGYCIGLKFLSFITELIGNKYTIMLGLVINTFSVLLLCPVFFIPKSIAAVIVGITLIGFGGVLITVPGILDLIQTLKARLNCDEYEANNNASAIYNLAGSLGESLGPLIGGYLTESINFQSACFTTSVINIAFFVMFLIANYKAANYEYSLKENKSVYEEFNETGIFIKRSFTITSNKYSLSVPRKNIFSPNVEYELLSSSL